jgi:UDPglucose--hexose-1-phosphate uridylyltransferase
MAELRKDPITREWVNIASERGRRPSDFARCAPAVTAEKALAQCPFCPGREGMSDPDLLRYPRYASEWSVRVVPNKFAAFSDSREPERGDRGMYETMPAFGSHEVVIDTPEHNKSFARLSVGQIELVLRAYRERDLALLSDPRFKYVLIFHNHGEAAGASIAHSHSQIISTAVVPQHARIKIEGVRRYQKETGRCVYGDIVEQELREGTRVVARNGTFVAFAPFASRCAYETWIMPLERKARFADIASEELRNLAAILRETLLRLEIHLNDPAWNFVFLTTELTRRFHWHVEITPRLNVPAGFELGSRIYINPVAPEAAAERLRAVRFED